MCCLASFCNGFAFVFGMVLGMDLAWFWHVVGMVLVWFGMVLVWFSMTVVRFCSGVGLVLRGFRYGFAMVLAALPATPSMVHLVCCVWFVILPATPV